MAHGLNALKPGHNAHVGNKRIQAEEVAHLGDRFASRLETEVRALSGMTTVEVLARAELVGVVRTRYEIAQDYREQPAQQPEIYELPKPQPIGVSLGELFASVTPKPGYQQ